MRGVGKPVGAAHVAGELPARVFRAILTWPTIARMLDVRRPRRADSRPEIVGLLRKPKLPGSNRELQQALRRWQLISKAGEKSGPQGPIEDRPRLSPYRAWSSSARRSLARGRWPGNPTRLSCRALGADIVARNPRCNGDLCRAPRTRTRSAAAAPAAHRRNLSGVLSIRYRRRGVSRHRQSSRHPAPDFSGLLKYS
jgi:hypothetical protein